MYPTRALQVFNFCTKCRKTFWVFSIKKLVQMCFLET
jgi:hypothetical protein